MRQALFPTKIRRTKHKNQQNEMSLGDTLPDI